MPHISAWKTGVSLAAGAISLGVLLYSSRNALGSDVPKTIPSPLATLLSQLSKDDVKNLPYPPDALPGARDVHTPYGCIRVYEWGPETGHKVLLIHGISTPSIALGKLAHELVDRGCRVMLFGKYSHFYFLNSPVILDLLVSMTQSWALNPYTCVMSLGF
jgi:hypothetical protein